ncbi:MAG TPA: lmo0937 family membrane protein [Polyangiaceae bacterium]
MFGTQLHIVSAKRAAGYRASNTKEVRVMLWTIFVVLLVLWLLGMVSAYTLGGYIHILLVLAVVALIIRLIQGRPVA